MLFIVTMFFRYAVAQDTCFSTFPYGRNKEAGAYAKINGIQMYYEIYGPSSSPPLLLIHGSGGSVRAMRCQIEHFRQNYKVIVADSRYHGSSENGDRVLTYELMANDYAALLHHLKLDSVYVLGQSDGAIITLLLAIHHPSNIKKGIAMAPNLRPDSTAVHSVVINSVKQELDSINSIILAGNKEPALLRKQAQNKLLYEQPNIHTSALSQIKVPILLMASDGDVIKLEHILEMYHALPKANLLVMPAATHGMLRQEYRLFNQMCQRFLATPFRRTIIN